MTDASGEETTYWKDLDSSVVRRVVSSITKTNRAPLSLHVTGKYEAQDEFKYWWPAELTGFNSHTGGYDAVITDETSESKYWENIDSSIIRQVVTVRTFVAS